VTDQSFTQDGNFAGDVSILNTISSSTDDIHIFDQASFVPNKSMTDHKTDNNGLQQESFAELLSEKESSSNDELENNNNSEMNDDTTSESDMDDQSLIPGKSLNTNGSDSKLKRKNENAVSDQSFTQDGNFAGDVSILKSNNKKASVQKEWKGKVFVVSKK
jgi:hypothetical protein